MRDGTIYIHKGRWFGWFAYDSNWGDWDFFFTRRAVNRYAQLRSILYGLEIKEIELP